MAVAWIYGANYSIAKIILDPGLIAANGFILLRLLAAGLPFLLFFWFSVKDEPSAWAGLTAFSFCSLMGWH